MAAIPTIKVHGEAGGFVVINAADFDEKIHRVFSEKPAPVVTDEPTKAEAAPKRKAKV